MVTTPQRAGQAGATDAVTIDPDAIDESTWLSIAARHHRAIVRLASAFDDDARAAQRLALRAWNRALYAGWLRLPADELRRRLLTAVVADARRSEDAGVALSSQPEAPRVARPGSARTAIAEAVEALPRPQRAVFVLRDVEGWAGRDIRELLDLEPEAYRSLLHAARRSVVSRQGVALGA